MLFWGSRCLRRRCRTSRSIKSCNATPYRRKKLPCTQSSLSWWKFARKGRREATSFPGFSPTCPSLAPLGRVGQNPGNEVGSEGENARDFASLLSSVPLPFVTSHSRVTRVSRLRLLEKRGALGEAEKEVFRAFFTRTHNIFFHFRKILLDHWFHITEQWM